MLSCALLLFGLLDITHSNYYYKLENDLDSSFGLDYETRVCDGFNEWSVENGGADTGNVYLKPSDVPSCVAFSFDSSPNGFLEIKVVLNSVSSMDKVEITVYSGRTMEDEIIGKAQISSMKDQSVCNGSHVFNVPAGSDGGKLYVAIIGQADKKSIMKIVSIKYIPGSIGISKVEANEENIPYFATSKNTKSSYYYFPSLPKTNVESQTRIVSINNNYTESRSHNSNNQETFTLDPTTTDTNTIEPATTTGLITETAPLLSDIISTSDSTAVPSSLPSTIYESISTTDEIVTVPIPSTIGPITFPEQSTTQSAATSTLEAISTTVTPPFVTTEIKSSEPEITTTLFPNTTMILLPETTPTTVPPPPTTPNNNSTTEPTTEAETLSPESDEEYVIQPLTIVLITLPCILITSLIIVAVYYFCFAKKRDSLLIKANDEYPATLVNVRRNGSIFA